MNASVQPSEVMLDVDNTHKVKLATPSQGDLFDLPNGAEHVRNDTIVIETYTLQVAGGVAQRVCCTTTSGGARVCWNC